MVYGIVTAVEHNAIASVVQHFASATQTRVNQEGEEAAKEEADRFQAIRERAKALDARKVKARKGRTPKKQEANE